jgi:tyrosine phenol-lyase
VDLLTLRDEEMAPQNVPNLLIISEGFFYLRWFIGQRHGSACHRTKKKCFDADYLHYRIRSTAYLGEHLKAKGIPVVWAHWRDMPFYIDAKKNCTRPYLWKNIRDRLWCATCTSKAASAVWKWAV